jgi:hypothetical protein
VESHPRRRDLFNFIKHYWNRFDNHVIKPWLLHDWPHSKIEHEEITIKIKNLFNEYQKFKRERKVNLKVEEMDCLSSETDEQIDVQINTVRSNEEEPEKGEI